MIDLILFSLFGITVGILGGLLPALPVYIGAFLLYTFHQDLNVTEILVFWLSSFIGGQYFGSIATITTNIPGEESSLVYINDLYKFDLYEKNKLLYDTALSSSVATFLAIGLMWLGISFLRLNELPFLYSVNVQVAIYVFLILSFLLVNKEKWFIILLTILFGVSIAPRANYALPNNWYDWTWLFDGYTFYLVILGILIIPNLFTYDVDIKSNKHFEAVRDRNFNWWRTFKASIIGFIAGLIPGPSAETGSIAAYRFIGKNKKEKIIAAEAANNSAILASVIPFFMMTLPVNNNTLLISGILDMHGLTMSDEILAPSGYLGLNVIDLVTLILIFVTGLYYLLSTTFIDFYVKIMKLIHGKIKLVLLGIVLILIYLDLLSAEITIEHYLILLGFFTFIGFVLKKFNISAIPMMFSILLGDRLIWAGIQVSKIYF